MTVPGLRVSVGRGQHLLPGGVSNFSQSKASESGDELADLATSLTFNPTSEILAAASQVEDEPYDWYGPDVRPAGEPDPDHVHLPSLSVFSNFPVSNRKFLYRASCLDFSPHSGFFALANNKGHAPLFRLLHYKDF
ncbi:hypothetical protein INR49_003592 [Caranx melampygus]|nr:hypothetical protein INR49_003592 [Caranx melampygus]